MPEANTLVRLAVEHQIARVHIKGHPGFSLDPNAPAFDERFFHFEALGVLTPESVSAHIGSYAANKRTADVWDMASCCKVGFPALRRLQTKSRRQYNLPNREPATVPNHGQPPRLC